MNTERGTYNQVEYAHESVGGAWGRAKEGTEEGHKEGRVAGRKEGKEVGTKEWLKSSRAKKLCKYLISNIFKDMYNF